MNGTGINKGVGLSIEDKSKYKSSGSGVHVDKHGNKLLWRSEDWGIPREVTKFSVIVR